MNNKTKFKLVVYTFLLLIALSILMWWFFYNQTKTRDYQRLSDIKTIQAELTEYYRQFNTYKIPECQNNSLVHFCTGRRERVLAFDDIVDPVNDGPYQYMVDSLFENDYIISFSFEGSVAGIPAGSYVLTKGGIGK